MSSKRFLGKLAKIVILTLQNTDLCSYNMPIYAKQYSVQFNPFNAPQLGIADGITYKPQYLVGGCKYTKPGWQNNSCPCICELEDMAYSQACLATLNFVH